MENPIVSPRKGLEIFRDVRAKLTRKGLSREIAEVYAKDVVSQYGTLVAKGRRFEALALVTDEYADMVAEMHRQAFQSVTALARELLDVRAGT